MAVALKEKRAASLPVTCHMCNTKLLTAQEQIEHEFSLMHHIKLDQVKESKGTHNCNLCQLQIGGIKLYVGHLNGKKHQRTLDHYRQRWSTMPPKNPPVPPSFLLSPSEPPEKPKTPKEFSQGGSKNRFKVTTNNERSHDKDTTNMRSKHLSNTSNPASGSKDNQGFRFGFREDQRPRYNERGQEKNFNQGRNNSYNNNWCPPFRNNQGYTKWTQGYNQNTPHTWNNTNFNQHASDFWHENWNNEGQWYQNNFGAQDWNSFGNNFYFDPPHGNSNNQWNPSVPLVNETHSGNRPNNIVEKQDINSRATRNSGEPSAKDVSPQVNRKDEVAEANPKNPIMLTKNPISQVNRDEVINDKFTSKDLNSGRIEGSQCKDKGEKIQERSAIKKKDEALPETRDRQQTKDRYSRVRQEPDPRTTGSRWDSSSNLTINIFTPTRDASDPPNPSDKQESEDVKRDSSKTCAKPRNRNAPKGNLGTKKYKSFKKSCQGNSKSAKNGPGSRSVEKSKTNSSESEVKRETGGKGMPVIEKNVGKKTLGNQSKSDKNSNQGKTGHLFFVSSDGESDCEQTEKNSRVVSPKPKAKSRQRFISTPVKESSTSKNDYNKALINQLVNNPCTRKQQMQLKRWMKNHAQTQKRLTLPRFNLPLADSETGTPETDEAEMKIIVTEAISELPEDVIVSLFEALSNDGSEARNDSVANSSNKQKENNVDDLTEEGNLPWSEFLKSLSISDPFEFEESSEIPPTNTLSVDDEVSPTKVTNKEVSHPNTDNGPIWNPHIKKELLEPPVIELDSSCDSIYDGQSPKSQEPIDDDVILEEILLPVRIKTETMPDQEIPAFTHSSVQTPNTSIGEENCASSASEPQPDPLPINVPSTSKSPARSLLGSATSSPSLSVPYDLNSNTPKSTTQPSVAPNNTYDQSQEDLTNWLNQNDASTMNFNCAGDTSGSCSYAPQELVNQLITLSREEDQLRDNTQKVEQMITQLYKILEEWKSKRTEILQEELRLRTKRSKLLESLKSFMSKKDDSEKSPQSPKIHTDTPVEEAPQNVTYLGTLDQTFDILNQIGSTIGINIARREVDSDYSSEPASKKKKKGKKPGKRKKDGSTEQPAKKTKVAQEGNQKSNKKKKTNKANKNKEATDNENPFSPAMLEQIMASLSVPATASDNLSHSIPLQAKGTNAADVRLPRFLVSDEEDDLSDKTFGPINIHTSAIIDLKISKGCLYTCSSDASAKCINIRDSTKIVAFDEHKKTVSAILVTPSEEGKEYVFTASHDGYLRCFDSETGECVNRINAHDPIICMTKGWSKLFVGLYNGLIVPYSIANAKFLEPIMCSDSSISKIVTCSEGSTRLLCVASYDGSVTLRDPLTGLLIRCLSGKVRPPCHIHVDTTLIYITTADRTIRLHDLVTGGLMRTVTCPSSATGLYVCREYVLSCGFDGLIRCYRKKDWTLHSLYYGAGKTMIMCMEVWNNWVYTGNRHGIIEAFEINFKSVVPCRFQNCGFPYGRSSDLKHHLETDHLKSINYSTTTKCPWRSCDTEFSGRMHNETREHILSHCVIASPDKY